MDIHRCRFVPYPPQSINALAFSHPSDSSKPTPKDLRLAVGRASGDIELWSPLSGNWFQERVFRGGENRLIEQLAWTQDLLVEDSNISDAKAVLGSLRLFSSGGSSSITEWDLTRGIPRRNAECNSGHIWCFAAQPQWPLSTDRSIIAGAPSQLLAAGCSNGTVVLFNTTDDDLQYERVLSQPPGKKSKVISITWRDRNTIVIGYDRGTIRVVDVRSRAIIRDMSLGKPLDGSFNLVWSLRCLPDGTILSGDSSGELKIWDPRNFSLVQRLRTHEADVLDIAVSEKGDLIYTSGVDRRTVLYRPVTGNGNMKNQRWQQVHHRRFHQHDVKAIATFESKDLSVAVSGGMDSIPIVIPLRNWDKEHHRALTHLPQKPQISICSEQRLLLTWWANEIQIWCLPGSQVTSDPTIANAFRFNDHRLVGKIQLQDEENICSAAICSTGDLIIVSTSSTTKLFQLRKRDNTSAVQLRFRQVELPVGLRSFGSHSVGFSPNGKWLYAVRLSNLVALAKIQRASSGMEKPRLQPRLVKLDRQRRRNQEEVSHGFNSYLAHISSIAFSSDSRILAIGDLSGRIDAWILEGHENQGTSIATNGENDENSEDSSSDSDSEDESDTFVIDGQKWTNPLNGSELPRMDSSILSMSFKPSSAAAISPAHIQGNLGLHATRHNPHPVSHEAPVSSSAHLWVVTAKHSVVEIDLLASRLSDWTRRNPSTVLPRSFRQIKDRIMGSWWDCNPQRKYERLWLYGCSWVFMFDVSKDINSNDQYKSQNQNVGKMGNHEVVASDRQQHNDASNCVPKQVQGQKRRRNTGAGDAMRQSKKLSATVHKLENSETTSVQSDDESDEEVSDALVALRRGIGHDEAQEAATEQTRDQILTWHTFQYRSIFGACRLEAATPVNEDGDNIEVIVIERPLHDIEFGPRFAGGQDWE